MAKMIADCMEVPLIYSEVDTGQVRPGYDLNYDLDASKLHNLKDCPKFYLTSQDYLAKIVTWYLKNKEWL